MMEVYFLCIYCLLAAAAVHYVCIQKSIKQLYLFFRPVLLSLPLPLSIFPFIFRNIGNGIAIDEVATSVVDREKTVYHISVTRNEHRQLYLQLIIVDRYEYDEHSTRLMEHLKSSVLSKLFVGESTFKTHHTCALTLFRFFYRPIKILFHLRPAFHTQREWSRIHIHFRHILPGVAVHGSDLCRLL